MRQQTKLEKPKTKTQDPANIPETARKIAAIDLLDRPDKVHIQRTAAAIAVKYGDQVYMVTLHHMVPETAQVLRTSDNSIVGFSAVAGG